MIIAVEGPSYAGKTTALRELKKAPCMREAVFAPCYVKSIPRIEDIPRPATASATEQLAAFDTFMAIEADRTRRLTSHHGPVILDRSVDTLMAHAYALDEMYGFDVHETARDRLEGLPHLRPDHTLYLDVSAEVLALRRKAAGHQAVEPDYFLHDSVFLAHTRDYFCQPARTPVAAQMTIIPGDGSPEENAALVQTLAGLWSAT